MLQHRNMRRLAVGAAVAGLVLTPAVINAIYVNPTAVFIDHATGHGHVTLGNSSETPEEVTIDLKFGFLDTDSAGTPFVRLLEEPGPQFPSAAEWIRPFPRRVRLMPGQQQVVRLLASPPDDLPDGEYWSRLIVTSRSSPIALATGDTAVSVGVNLEIRLVTSVLYRKGRVTTGITLSEFTASAENDSVVVWARLERQGNGAYLGRASFEVVDQLSGAAREWSTPLAVYYPIRRRFAFPLQGVDAGQYLVRLRLVAERPDMPDGQVLPAPPVADSVMVRVP